MLTTYELIRSKVNYLCHNTEYSSTAVVNVKFEYQNTFCSLNLCFIQIS